MYSFRTQCDIEVVIFSCALEHMGYANYFVIIVKLLCTRLETSFEFFRSNHVCYCVTKLVL